MEDKRKVRRKLSSKKKKSERSSNKLFPILLVFLLLLISTPLAWSYSSGNSLPIVGNVVSQYSDKSVHTFAQKSAENTGYKETIKGETQENKDTSFLGIAKKSVRKVADAIGMAKDKLSKNSHKDINSAKAKQPETSKAKLAFIIDDFGYNKEVITAYNKMDIPLTYAVLPYETYSIEAANSGAAAGKDIILHLPMESVGHANAENTTISTSMTDAEIKKIVNKAIESTPHIIGVNNHQGSQATADKRVMTDILKQIHNDGLYYIDSRTSSASIAYDTAQKLGVPTGENQLFIDNNSDVQEIEAQIQKGADIALKHGSAIIIGHARPHTVEAIRNMIEPLQKEGIEFVYVKDLL